MKFFVRFWHQLCGIYTVSGVLLLLINLAFSGTLSQSVINAKAFLLLFIFSAVFAVANIQFSENKFPFMLRLFLHVILTVGGAFCLLYLPNNSGSAGSSKMLMFFLLLLIYWVPMGIVLVFRVKKTRVSKKAETDTYSSIFGRKNVH